MSNRTQLNIYLALGTSENNEVKMIDYFFDCGDMKGVTGSSFHWCSPDHIQESNDLDNLKDNYGYMWQEAVEAGNTEDSLDDYIENMLESYLTNSEGLFFCHDTSYVYELSRDETFLKYVSDQNIHDSGDQYDFWDDEIGTFECVGGGRCFDKNEGELESYVSQQRKIVHLMARDFEAGTITIDEVEKQLVDLDIPFKKECR